MAATELLSYLEGEWRAGRGGERTLFDPATGEETARFRSGGHDLAAALDYGRRRGGEALRSLTFRQRGTLVSELAASLRDARGRLRQLAATYGATEADARMDVDGGLFTLAYHGRLGASLPDAGFLCDGATEPLSRGGGFAGRHVFVPRPGVAVQINAYNFPCWGPLEKLGPALLAGMPTLVKPASRAALVSFALVREIVESGVVPEGSVQLLIGSAGDLLDHLRAQDVVLFTGSAGTAADIRAHPRVVSESVRVNVEADSLNSVVLGPDGTPGSPAREGFLAEVMREMTEKAGQKCTAIRRALVPESEIESVSAELAARVGEIVSGAPGDGSGPRMGPLADRDAVRDAEEGVQALLADAEVVARGEVEGDAGAYFPATVLRLREGAHGGAVDRVEVFGPVATLIPYRDAGDAARRVREAGGSLVASVFSADRRFLSKLLPEVAPWSGRVLVMSDRALSESTGHGTVMPQLIHGGPGRAGGGSELGGMRGLSMFLNRCALQGDPEALAALFPEEG